MYSHKVKENILIIVCLFFNEVKKNTYLLTSIFNNPEGLKGEHRTSSIVLPNRSWANHIENFMSQVMSGPGAKEMLAHLAKSQLFQSHLVTGPTFCSPVCLLKYSTVSYSVACD